jgi:thiamine-phosphate pyrophosphorylase
VKNVPIPFVAIGGIKEQNLASVHDLGARTVCLVTDIVGAPDIAAKLRRLRNILGEH